jgi:hypothetical protein
MAENRKTGFLAKLKGRITKRLERTCLSPAKLVECTGNRPGESNEEPKVGHVQNRKRVFPYLRIGDLISEAR